MKFNEILRKLRVSASGKKQKDVAADLSLSGERYNQYETGKREPDFETLLRIADYFGVSADYLLGNDNEPVRTAPSLSITEQQLINQFRAASPELKKAILAVASAAGETHNYNDNPTVKPFTDFYCKHSNIRAV